MAGIAQGDRGEGAAAQPIVWYRSAFCANSGCIELAEVDGGILIRDSKAQDGPQLAVSREELAAFVAGAKAGQFDPMCRPATPPA